MRLRVCLWACVQAIARISMHIATSDQSIGASGEAREKINEGKRTEALHLIEQARAVGERFREHVEDCVGRAQRDHITINSRMHKNIENGKISCEEFMNDNMRIEHLQSPEHAQDIIEKFRNHMASLKGSDGIALKYPNMEKHKAPLM